MTGYQEAIKRVVPDLDPTHVEAIMRIERPTLDALDRRAFNKLARESADLLRTEPEARKYAERYAL